MTHRRRIFGFIAIAGVVLWLCSGVLFCESALRVPRKPAPASDTVAVTAADGVILRADFIRNRASRDCVMVLHGIADSRSSSLGFAPMFVESGYSVLAPDSRAHGASGGEYVTFGVLEASDVLLWASWLQRQGCGRLFGLGESLGAAILIQAAARERVFAAIVAECPFSELATIAEYRVAQFINAPGFVARPFAKAIVSSGMLYARAWRGLNLSEASPLRTARSLTTPLLLIHGLDDVNTPPSHSRAIHEAAQGSEVWFVPGAGHANACAQEPAAFRERVLGWFGRAAG